MDCLFCKIARKELPSDVIVYENDAAMAFLDIHPLSLGHTLVIPKIHYENIITLKEDEITPLFSAVKKITEQLMKVLSPHGFTIGINHGKDAGQVVDHLHIHVIPRYLGDGGRSIHSIIQNSSPYEEGLHNIAKKIRISQ